MVHIWQGPLCDLDFSISCYPRHVIDNSPRYAGRRYITRSTLLRPLHPRLHSGNSRNSCTTCKANPMVLIMHFEFLFLYEGKLILTLFSPFHSGICWIFYSEFFRQVLYVGQPAATLTAWRRRGHRFGTLTHQKW